ncbi:MAG: glycoside hydrolase family 127 protein [Chloroflexi bacterium]|nr:glycoside hydrolase family 127 protein [Chloroflexota bacterium]
MSDEIRDYPITPVPFDSVKIQDKFWKPRIDTAVNVTIPYDFEKCQETGRIDNFAKAGGLMEGPHQGIFYDDSDVFKVVEGAAYALQIAPNPTLESYVDDLIDKFAAAQEDDGYLYTARTIDPVNIDHRCGAQRWSNLAVNHELYNVGHMYEAAVAYFEATGKRKFLDVALKNADLIDSVFGRDKLRDVPGHQEIEIGLVRLYRVTGELRYLKLARFFLNERGRAHGRALYGPICQDHMPVTEQSEAVGHAVRAGYLYAGMTDMAALTGDTAYASAVSALWENVVGKKLALTGGIGARHEGEAFGDNYELPNLTAYNETCAAQSNILWNHRLFLLTGEAKYVDVLERTLYNGFLSGVGMDGTSFYYVNPLACDGEYPFNRERAMSRQPWYQTSCCPTNVVRLLPSLSGYIYALRDQALYVNLYVGDEAAIRLEGGEISITQTTDYPWGGAVAFDIAVSKPSAFALKLRIPSFAQSSPYGKPLPSDLYRYLDGSADAPSLSIDGEDVPVEVQAGYATVYRHWEGTTRVRLSLPMPIRTVVAHPAVDELKDKVALERGPLVYALEAADNDASLLDLALDDSGQLRAEHSPHLLGGVTSVQGNALDPLGNAVKFTAIPYYAWGHRGDGQMTVWLNRRSI